MASPANPLEALRQKGAALAPAQPAQAASAPQDENTDSQQDGDESPDATSESGTQTEGSEKLAGSHNIARAYSKLNQAIIDLADGTGVKRTATIPHVKGEGPAEHFQNIGTVLRNSGGLTSNLLAGTHSIHDSDGGKTVAYSAKKLHETIIPKGSKEAKAAIDACKNVVNKIGALIPDAPEVTKAKSQLKLVGKNDGGGMSVSDLMMALIHIPAAPIQAIAREHSGTKPGGHSPQLRVPFDPQVQGK